MVIQALERQRGFFIALHFSTSCAKCIAVIASGCLPQRLFTPCITMLAYCSPQNRVQFATASIYGVREVHPGITCRSVGYQVKSNTGYSLIWTGELSDQDMLPTCLVRSSSVLSLTTHSVILLLYISFPSNVCLYCMFMARLLLV